MDTSGKAQEDFQMVINRPKKGGQTRYGLKRQTKLTSSLLGKYSAISKA